MAHPLYFDYAATTPCCEEAIFRMAPFSAEFFGHPSSAHAYGQKAATVIREARRFFAESFGVEPEQIVFTGSGTEADNLAIYGPALTRLSTAMKNSESIPQQSPRPLGKILYSAIEHSAVSKTASSLRDFGFDPNPIAVTPEGQIDEMRFNALLGPDVQLVSIHLVNNILGTLYPIESLAQKVKSQAPLSYFHTDAIQAFGRVELPHSGSAVDMVSISSHKIEGPKGVGALILLNRKLVKTLRPLIWGGGQEAGLRSGTQNAGLIAGFHAAAQMTLAKRSRYTQHTIALRQEFQAQLLARGLLQKTRNSRIHWNSPALAVPHIVNISFPGIQAGPLARLLEERNCLVSTGSACSAGKTQLEPVLVALGATAALQTSAIRVSFSDRTSREDIHTLAQAIEDSILRSDQLSGNIQKRQNS
ncbi:MAG TPA: hypothetical protein DCS07_04715 [Bdellovibrionales bacterium]|nr:MAG: hypothetical protein A2Z97_14885 [Bdellovibrionales bacterium GWB1_52_6]OFZ02626.1 MAG: hypothetical protein A2X97_08225 [Bdellovibrionales bacterium GWA1_52_35]OFZ43910.1 MAG: hypothetical protein A2070_14120 [Bdellovibrionales bacterium GWC1_52_8]HAR41922.1 hypothetical protein [Bdellovibrionales bacterium]HCM41488.1 hypothetical protein [Bdellovibrionales bacterium]